MSMAHGVGRVEMAVSPLDPVARHVLAEEHHVGLQEAAAARARRHGEGREIGAVEIGVAVGRFRRVKRQPLRIEADEFALKFSARRKRAAGHAAHPVEPSVQVDHLLAAGGLMQAVDVLGGEVLAFAQNLEPGERAMGGVRRGRAEPPPADEAARPIAPPRRLALHEGLVRDRLGALPLAVGVAIVGNP